jgi:hypothetical protein
VPLVTETASAAEDPIGPNKRPMIGNVTFISKPMVAL